MSPQVVVYSDIMVKGQSERRKTQRVEWPGSVRYRLASVRGGWRTAQGMDLSGGGLRLQTAEPLPVHAEAEVSIAMPKAGAKPLRARGEVRWCRAKGPQWLLGVRLAEVSPRAAWAEYVGELMLNACLPR